MATATATLGVWLRLVDGPFFDPLHFPSLLFASFVFAFSQTGLFDPSRVS